MRSIYQRGGEARPFGINMTPMIDITFLLLTFFTLTSHFASAEKLDIPLPRPDDSRAVDRRLTDKVIINVLYVGPHRPAELHLGPYLLPSADVLLPHLQAAARQQPQPQVILRADRRLPYGQVRELMEMVAGAGLSRLQVVAVLGSE